MKQLNLIGIGIILSLCASFARAQSEELPARTSVGISHLRSSDSLAGGRMYVYSASEGVQSAEVMHLSNNGRIRWSKMEKVENSPHPSGFFDPAYLGGESDWIRVYRLTYKSGERITDVVTLVRDGDDLVVKNIHGLNTETKEDVEADKERERKLKLERNSIANFTKELNEFRALHGAGPVVYDEQLSQVAAHNNFAYYAGKGPFGSTVGSLGSWTLAEDLDEALEVWKKTDAINATLKHQSFNRYGVKINNRSATILLKQ